MILFHFILLCLERKWTEDIRTERKVEELWFSLYLHSHAFTTELQGSVEYEKIEVNWDRLLFGHRSISCSRNQSNVLRNSFVSSTLTRCISQKTIFFSYHLRNS